MPRLDHRAGAPRPSRRPARSTPTSSAGFIRAEVVAFDDLWRPAPWPPAARRGTLRLEGKDYVVQDGDVINFRFNV